MNKEKLLELSDTLRGIAEGTHVASFEQWHEDGWINCKLKYRHEPQPPPPDPYAELKAAHAAGKTIQNASFDRSGWFDAPYPNWNAPVDMYRIKPEPRKVPLGPDDVPPSSVIRGIGYVNRWSNCYSPILNITPDGILLSKNLSDKDTIFCNWGDLQWMFQINRSIPLTGKWDKDAWGPCHKEVSE